LHVREIENPHAVQCLAGIVHDCVSQTLRSMFMCISLRLRPCLGRLKPVIYNIPDTILVNCQAMQDYPVMHCVNPL
jgi:hypothetical protein